MAPPPASVSYLQSSGAAKVPRTGPDAPFPAGTCAVLRPCKNEAMTKRISILGSTGSIGTQALEVARWRGYRVEALAAGRNARLLLEQVHEFRPRLVSCAPEAAREIEAQLPAGTKLVEGAAGALEVAQLDVDTVVAAIPGIAGLAPTRRALECGQHVALANKEAMVVAGPLMWEAARAGGGRITPLDYEHSALYQALR